MRKTFGFVLVLGLAAPLGLTAADDGNKKDEKAPPAAGLPGPSKPYIAPVMRSQEAADTVLVLLPGPAPEPVAPPPATAVVRPAPAVSSPAEGDTTTSASEAAASEEALGGPRPYMRHAPNVYPDDFQKDTLKYFQERIGKLTADDVAEMLGPATRERPAFGDDQKENGTIHAFADPTGQFKEYELDFAGETGALRTVFAYPVQMTWQECRKRFGAKVTATDAGKGRKFYSYADRRLDVLVGADGKVVSLGLY
jgi:hypothetical protein